MTSLILASCAPSLPQGAARDPNTNVPDAFAGLRDSSNSGLVEWQTFFTDPHLVALIDTALDNNQELNITVQEILITNNEILAARGEYLPRLGFGAGAGVEHVGQFTSQGQSDENLDIPDNLQSYSFGLYAGWEIDIWGRLRNLANAAVYRYLASMQGRNFMVTRLVTEIASSYYELMALDRQLEVVQNNIALMENSLQIVRLQLQAARTTSLAVARFEAELRNYQSRQYTIQQQIVEAENRINFLVGRFPQPVERSTAGFMDLEPPAISVGVPSDLLENRPDVLQAELQLEAAQLDVSAARAAFYPTLGIEGVIGYQSYDITKLVNTPDSLLYGLFASVFAPLLNRTGLRADYYSANSRQMQAVLQYERAILTAFIEVSNRVALIRNIAQSYELKQQQVDRLIESIDIAMRLFNSARADYLEVLTTRRDSLEAQMELIEMKQRQMIATVTLYQALGGGWRGTERPLPGQSDDDEDDDENDDGQ